MPDDTYLLPLLGHKWIQEYGKGIDYLHYHNYLEIGYCYEGEGEIVLLDKTYQYHDNTLTILPKNCPHTTNSTPHTMSRWEYLYIDEENFVKDIMVNANSSKAEDILNLINDDALVLDAKDYPLICDYLKKLFDEMRYQHNFFLEISHGLASCFLFEVARIRSDMNKVNKQEENKYSEYVLDTIIYIENNYDKHDLDVEMLAQEKSISASHLRRIFKKETGKHLVEYINEVRVGEACRLLRQSNLSIGDIAYRIGYSSISTFNRNFKELKKVSPKEWRQRPNNFEQKLNDFVIHNEEGW